MSEPPVYDLFISYADADRAWVEGYLLDTLEQAGVRYHSETAFQLGVPRLLEFERAVRQSARTLLVLSPAYLADEFIRFADILAQSYGLESNVWPVIPLVLKPVTLPPRLKLLTALDARDPNDWPRVIADLCIALARPIPSVTTRPSCPYPGMVPFESANAHVFYGREQEIRDLRQRLHHQRGLFVIGPSGSGKSSLVAAGLLPNLAADDYFPPDFWYVRQMRPSDQPLHALQQALGDDLANPPQALTALLAAHPPAQRLLLVIDQFEELFTQADRAVQTSFIAALRAISSTERAAVLVALRADFYPDLMTSELWPLTPGQRIEIAPLRGDALRQAIQQPAADVGVALEGGLLERLLADAADEPGALPLMQETMRLLWGTMRRRLLTLADYADLGSDGRSGLAVALATKADAALADLTSTQQTLARRIFLRLVQFGEGRADTRRQQPVTALRTASDDPVLFERTLQYLVDERLLTLSGGEADELKLVDIAHETLIHAWPTLQAWVTERREAEQIRRRLEGKAAEWVRLRRQGGLLDVAELAEAERWLTGPDAAELGVDAPLAEVVAASQLAIQQAEQEREAIRQEQVQRAQALAEEQRQRAEEQAEASRRQRQRAIYLAIALAVAVVAAVAAGWFGVAAQRSADAEQAQKATAIAASQQAERAATQALVRQLIAQAGRDASTQPDRALLFSVEAIHLTDEVQARGMLLSALIANKGLAGFMRGHNDAVWSVAFSPDGATLASASADQTVRLWDVTSRQSLGDPLKGHTSAVLSIAFSPDGKTVASGGADKSIRLWDVGSRQPLGDPLPGLAGPVLSLVFSPDGEILASSELSDDTLQLWDVATRQPRGEPLPGRSLTVAFSPDGRTLAAGGSGSIRLWDVDTRQPLGDLLQADSTVVTSVAFSSDGTVLAAASGNIVQLWNVATRQPLGGPLPSLSGNIVKSVAFSPDGLMLAAGSEDHTIQVWDMGTRQLRGDPLKGHTAAIYSVAFSPDGTTLASASYDRSIRLWDIASLQPLGEELPGKGSVAYSVAYSSDGTTLAAAGSDDRAVQLWDTRTRQPLGDPLTGHTATVQSVTFSPDGKTLASTGNDGTVRLWDVATRQPRGDPFQSHTEIVWSAAFSPDGTTLAAAGNDGSVQLWDIATHQLRGDPLQSQTDAIMSVAFSPDGTMLAFGSGDGTVRLWNAATHQPLGDPLQGHTNVVFSVAFSPDGTILASAGFDGTVRLWNVATHQSLGDPLQGHTNLVYSVAFSPDGMTLASAGGDGTIRLWDASSRQPLGDPFQGPSDDIVRSVAFSPDGMTLASASLDGTIRLWDTSVKSWIARACRIVGHNLTQNEWNQFVSSDRPYRSTCPQFPPGSGAPVNAP